MIPYDPAECPIVKIKVTPALVRKHTGVTVSKKYCRYIADRMSEYFGHNESGAKRELADLVEEPDEDYVRPTMTDTIEIEIDPYLLREVWNGNRKPRHPCTADDLLRVANYIDKHYLTSDNGGFKLVEEAMLNEGVWYGEDDRDDNPPSTGIRAAQAEVKRAQIERDKAKFRAEQMLATYSYDVYENGLDLLIRNANAFQAAQKRLQAAQRAVDAIRRP